MIAEGDVLLDGERSESIELDDAQHWARVYGELLVAVMGLDQQLGSDASGRIRQRTERWERRLAFWRNRCVEIIERFP